MTYFGVHIECLLSKYFNYLSYLGLCNILHDFIHAQNVCRETYFELFAQTCTNCCVINCTDSAKINKKNKKLGLLYTYTNFQKLREKNIKIVVIYK